MDRAPAHMKLTPDEGRLDEPAGGQDEQSVREDLAAAYRLAALSGWDFLIFNHITARVPGPDLHFLINPFGLTYEEITASNLLKIDLDGNLIDAPADAAVNRAGFVIHSAVHRARGDLHCVMHMHSLSGVAVAASAEGLLTTMSQDSLMFHERIAYHGYEGLVCSDEERVRIARDLGDKPAMILRNHGLLTGAPSVAGAFNLMYCLEFACRSQIALQSTGQALHPVSPEVARLTAEQYWPGVVPGPGYGRESFAALRRRLDRIDPSYRQ